MALYRRSSRFIVDAFRRYNSNTAPVRFYGLDFRYNSNTAPVRFYGVDRITARPMGYRWLNPNPRKKKIITLGLLGSGFATSVYFWNLETVPFTKRTHFVLLSTYIEKRISQLILKLAAEVYEWKMLPSHHPQSIRVQKIGQEIIGALLKELKKEEQSTADFEEFEWEFIVVDDPYHDNAECYPGGKVIVFTGLLDSSKTDAEIAATIGHEVGHAAARHSAEIMSGIFLWLTILPECVQKMTDRFAWLPYCRRHELEADYIGLLLMASAGYDPQVAIKVLEKRDLRKPRGDDYDDYLSTHPSRKKRIQSLSKPKVMEEALSLYREALKEKEADHPVGQMSFLNRLIGVFPKVLGSLNKDRIGIKKQTICNKFNLIQEKTIEQ